MSPFEFEDVIFILGEIYEKASNIHQVCSWKLIYLHKLKSICEVLVGGLARISTTMNIESYRFFQHHHFLGNYVEFQWISGV